MNVSIIYFFLIPYRLLTQSNPTRLLLLFKNWKKNRSKRNKSEKNQSSLPSII